MSFLAATTQALREAWGAQVDLGDLVVAAEAITTTIIACEGRGG
jgi:hypothetical protein